jgi:hypothetical protein
MSGWIKCSERMPNLGVPVLVSMNYGWNDFVEIGVWSCEPAAQRRWRRTPAWRDNHDRCMRAGVTAWMPLPEPPTNDAHDAARKETL